MGPILFLNEPNYIQIAVARPCSSEHRKLFVARVSVGPELSIDRREEKWFHAKSLRELSNEVASAVRVGSYDSIDSYDPKAGASLNIKEIQGDLRPASSNELEIFRKGYQNK